MPIKTFMKEISIKAGNMAKESTNMKIKRLIRGNGRMMREMGLDRSITGTEIFTQGIGLMVRKMGKGFIQVVNMNIRDSIRMIKKKVGVN
jgi:3-methyladenine DNA glycosylase Mpg